MSVFEIHEAEGKKQPPHIRNPESIEPSATLKSTDPTLWDGRKRPSEKSGNQPHSPWSKRRRQSIDEPWICSTLSSCHLNPPSDESHQMLHQTRGNEDPIGIECETTKEWQNGAMIPILPGQLYFTAHENEEQTKSEIAANPKLFFFSSELQEMYLPFSQDFGPVSLQVVDSFLRLIRQRLSHPRLKGRTLVYYSYAEPEYCTNTAFLLASYLVIDHRFSPFDAASVFAGIGNAPFRAFTDSGVLCPSRETLTLFDCLSALDKAITLGWYSPNSEASDAPAGPARSRRLDMTTVCDKFVAFRGPVDAASDLNLNRRRLRRGGAADSELFQGRNGAAEKEEPQQRARSSRTVAASVYAEAFVNMDVSVVVRLNGASSGAADGYDPETFTDLGIDHRDLPFPDCTPPPPSVVGSFFRLCSEATGLVAVHCQAGLGRTGTLLALYLMRRYYLTARQAIAWLRLVRPGSVIGAQQHFLEACERRGWSERSRDHILNPWLHLPVARDHQLAVEQTPAGLEDSLPVSQLELLDQVRAGESESGVPVETSRPGEGTLNSDAHAWMLLLNSYDEVRLSQPENKRSSAGHGQNLEISPHAAAATAMPVDSEEPPEVIVPEIVPRGAGNLKPCAMAATHRDAWPCATGSASVGHCHAGCMAVGRGVTVAVAGGPASVSGLDFNLKLVEAKELLA